VLPVISYTGGYGGVVIAENSQLTFAGCIRRDALRAFRARVPETTAGDAFERYVCSRSAALREALAGSRREGAWLGVGAIQPGIRTPWSPQDGRFVIGNAAAEAHPIIGEGISMAMQSASLLCEALIASACPGASEQSLQRVGAEYARQWRRAFASRLALAATCAHLAMQPWLAPLLLPLIARTPRLMTALARGAGKVRIAPAFQRPMPWRGFESLEDPN
jgi:flavin-dependent dehydrogenase